MPSSANAGAISTRTLNKYLEVEHFALSLLPFAVAAGTVVAALWSLAPIAIFIIPFSVAMAAAGLWNYRRNVLAVATRLSFQPATGMLTWANLRRRGRLDVASIIRIERTVRQPGVYQIVLRDPANSPVLFSFSFDCRAGLKALVDAITTDNPAIDISQLQAPKLWWRGLTTG